MKIKLSIEEQASKEALNQVYRSSVFGLGGNFFILLIATTLLVDKISLTLIICGFSAHMIILLLRSYLVYKYMKIHKNISDISHLNKWLKLYAIGAFFSGLAWGLIFFFIGNLSAEYHFLLYAIIVGLAGAGLLTLGTIFPIYLSFMLPMFSLTILWLLLYGTNLYIVTAFMTLLGIAYYAFTSLRFSQNFKQVFIEKETSKQYMDGLRQEHQSLINSESKNHKLTERMELALTGSNTSIVDWNLTNNDFYLSHNWKEMLGYTDSELPNIILTWRERVHRDDRKNLFSSLRRTKNEKIEYFENTHRLQHKDGHWVWILGRAQLLYNEDGTAVRMVGTHTDITQEKELQLNYSKQAQILEQVHDSVISTDLSGNITSWNIGSQKMLGYSTDEAIGKHMSILHRSQDIQKHINDATILQQVESLNVESYLVKKSGEIVSVAVSLSVLKNENAEIIGMIGISQDITQRKKAESELLRQKDILDHQAHHDALTGLANRVLFNDRVEQSLKKAKRSKSKMAILFIDLDHFKEINDSLGHAVGDEILINVTKKLNDTIRKEDSIARLGGDEFTIMMENLSQPQDASLLAKKILEVLSQPIKIDEHTLYVSSSIGISIFPDDGDSTQNLLKYADAAMYKAKNEGRNNFQFYSSEMTELAFERVVMEASLRAALKSEDFIVYYQPQVNANTDEITGMEALVRWNHTTMGLVSPAKFIPLAEATGLIIELDQQVMRTAMKQITQWYKEGLNPGKIALNLAVKQLEQKDFIDILKSMLDETKCKPEWIELEVTESKIMDNPQEAVIVLNKISDLGIELAIDDFGTGYSSLSYIKKLPINKLKIDQSFIRDLPYDKEDAAITRAVIALANNLNLKIIAEGVETQEQKEFLIQNGCENIQGYFYSKPIPADEMQKTLLNGVSS